MMISSSIRRSFFPLFVAGFYLFLYIPIVILIIFSFNNSPFSYAWAGFTLKWYYQLYESVEVFAALKNSLIVAVTSVCLSVGMGVMLVAASFKRNISRYLVMFYANLAAPEIVLAVGILSFFSVMSFQLGLVTLIAGHTLVGLGYVVPMVWARMQEFDARLREASLDLGANELQTFYRVVLPFLFPSIIGAALLVFVISLDDFIIAFFCSGGTTQTLPLYIFSVIRTGATPEINALSVILLCVTSLLVLLFSSLHVKKVGM